MWFYDNFKKVCAEKGTTLTQALRACGISTSCTGGWKSGQYPRLDIAIKLADYLGVSLDELVYAGEHDEDGAPAALSASEREWLSIVKYIPVDKQDMCKDFLRTHMVVPEKHTGKKRA